MRSDEGSLRGPARAPVDPTSRVLVIGAGGIGAPLALALVRAGVRELAVVDDDVVDRTNLHRQILYRDEDVGADKLDAFSAALRRLEPAVRVRAHRARFVPGSASALLDGIDVVVDATDNFASRFLIADACHLGGVPVVHAAAVRWTATVMAAAPEGAPCYRCLFEDLPSGDAPDCATAGVMGPVCGVSGAVAADLALRVLSRGALSSPYGFIVTYDGRTDRLRKVPVRPRPDCELCGASPTIEVLDEDRYAPPSCALGLD